VSEIPSLRYGHVDWQNAKMFSYVIGKSNIIFTSTFEKISLSLSLTI